MIIDLRVLFGTLSKFSFNFETFGQVADHYANYIGVWNEFVKRWKINLCTSRARKNEEIDTSKSKLLLEINFYEI